MDPKHLLGIFRKCWSIQTSTQYCTSNPAKGQCSATALVLNKYFGGLLLKTKTAEGWHFYNRINGRRLDLTACQFPDPVEYTDIESTWNEAMRDTSPSQYKHLEKTFLNHLQKRN